MEFSHSYITYSRLTAALFFSVLQVFTHMYKVDYSICDGSIHKSSQTFDTLAEATVWYHQNHQDYWEMDVVVQLINGSWVQTPDCYSALDLAA